MKVIPKTLLSKIKSGNHGEIFYNKINEVITQLGLANVIAFKENVNLKIVEDIDIDFISGKDATNTIPQFVIIEKANNVDTYAGSVAAVNPYIDITITGGLVGGQVIDFQIDGDSIIEPGGYTIPGGPTIAGVVSAIVATNGGNPLFIITSVNSSTFRVSVTSTTSNGGVLTEIGSSVVTYSTNTPTTQGGSAAYTIDMQIKLDSINIAQNCISSSSSLVYNSNRVYATHAASIISSLQTSKYVLNKVVPCTDDFYVNIYICGIYLE